VASPHGPDYAGGDIPHKLNCQACHAGAADNSFETMDEAHLGMISDPSGSGEIGCNVSGCHDGETLDSFASACAGCHSSHQDNWANSLHANLQGEVKAVEDRAAIDLDAAGYRDAFNNQCAECHATCGQCHVSRPHSAGGGFVHLAEATVSRSHLFSSPTSVDAMKEQCTACHGTRVATDYLGEGSDIPAEHSQDIHWVRRSFTCTACHDDGELHGDGTVVDHRYEVAAMPRCEECHGAGVDDGWDNAFHAKHVDGDAGDSKLQCQVCHAQPYRNCTNCHDPGTGTEYGEFFSLKIARNDPAAFPYRQDKGYDYVVVRHVPISQETYAHWGLVDLPDFTSKPTWLYASPHSIKLNTDQAATCGGCHGSDYYLQDSDLTTPEEQAANANLVIPPR